MLKKYNITINVLFWILISALIGIFLFAFLKPELKIASHFIEEEKEVIIEKEEVVVTEYQKVEYHFDWYAFTATGYSKNDPSQGTTSKTATGVEVREGIIAVDPSIIPYGTVVEIKDIGYFIAQDCGGKIKGNRIDIYFESKKEALDFGRQQIWVRFIGNSSIQIAVNN